MKNTVGLAISCIGMLMWLINTLSILYINRKSKIERIEQDIVLHSPEDYTVYCEIPTALWNRHCETHNEQAPGAPSNIEAFRDSLTAHFVKEFKRLGKLGPGGESPIATV